MAIVVQHNLNPIIGGLAAYRAGKAAGTKATADYTANLQSQIGGAAAQGVGQGFQLGWSAKLQRDLQDRQVAAQTAARTQEADIAYDQHLYQNYGIRAADVPAQMQSMGYDPSDRTHYEPFFRDLGRERARYEAENKATGIDITTPSEVRRATAIDTARYQAQYEAQAAAQERLARAGLKKMYGQQLDDATQIVTEFTPMQLQRQSELSAKIQQIDADETLHPDEKYALTRDLYAELGSIIPTTRFVKHEPDAEEQFFGSAKGMFFPGTNSGTFVDAKGVQHTFNADPAIPHDVVQSWVDDTLTNAGVGDETDISASPWGKFFAEQRDKVWTQLYAVAKKQAKEGVGPDPGTLDEYKLSQFRAEWPAYRQRRMQQSLDERKSAWYFVTPPPDEVVKQRKAQEARQKAMERDRQEQTYRSAAPAPNQVRQETQSVASESSPAKIAQDAAIVVNRPKDLSKLTRSQYERLVQAATNIKRVGANGNPTSQPVGVR